MDSRVRARGLVTIAAVAAIAATLAGSGSATIQTGPTIQVAPHISGTAQQGAVMSSTGGSWNSTGHTTFAYKWESCDSSGGSCSDISSATSETYTLQSSDIGLTVRSVVTATDTTGSTSQESDNYLGPVAAATAPANVAVPTISGTATVGSTLTADKGTWSGTEPIAHAYRWERCDSSGADCSSIGSATNHTYVLTNNDQGHKLRVEVTASNAAGSAQATSASTAVIAASVPANTVAPKVSGNAVVGQNLSVTTGTWIGTTPLTYTYQWQRCDSNGNSCTNITNATRTNYQIVTDDTGSKLRATVTATNSAGNSSATSNIVGPVPSSAPVNTATPVLSGTLTTGQNISVTSGTWTGLAPISYGYAWQRCNATASVCSAITGASHSSYLLQSVDVAAYMRVIVTATNKGGTATMTSNLVGPVLAALPRGATKLPNGLTSVPVDSLPTNAVLTLTSLKLTPTVIKHRHSIKLTVKVVAGSYVISGARLSVTATKPTWISRVTVLRTNINGLVTVLIRPTLKAPFKGTLILRLKALPTHGPTPTSATKTVKITMRK
ncbi:MAG TPA: hypothetical protein VFW85_11770 [Gaiellaceae bacterium]|nr:hypothetical protein [Gaiellaceae bacterium]